jgi:hypothetical protein
MTLPAAVRALIAAWVAANPDEVCSGAERTALKAAVAAVLPARRGKPARTDRELDNLVHQQLRKARGGVIQPQKTPAGFVPKALGAPNARNKVRILPAARSAANTAHSFHQR